MRRALLAIALVLVAIGLLQSRSGHALAVALTVIVLAGAAFTAAITAITFGVRLGADLYDATHRRAVPQVRRLRRWREFRSVRWDARRQLDTRYFDPWVQEERRRRRERS